MGIVELLGLAASVSLLSGWRLYLTVFATGLAMKSGYIDLPENLAMLDVLANPWVLGISALGAVVNTSPEPISNVLLSTAEDVAAGGLLVLAFANPVAAAVILLILTVIGAYIAHRSYRFIKRVFGPEAAEPPLPPSQ